MRQETRNYRLAFAALLLLSIFLCFFRLAAGGLRNGDEARYAIVAENILHTGDWVTLHYQDQPYFQKSPARFWLSAALFRVAGSNAFTVRFWSALFGVGAIVLTVLVGRRLYGRWAGLLAGFILATTPAFLFIHAARTGEMDTAVTFWWLLALLPLLRDELRPRDLLLSVAAAAAVGLFKHLAYTPVVLLNVGLVVAVRRGWRVLDLRTVVGAMAILLVILGPWYLAEWARHGNHFWRVIWGRVVTGPAFQTAEASATFGRAYYLGVLGAGAWPWSLLVPPAVIALLAKRPGTDRWRQWVPWLLLGVLLLFITVSERKLAWYATPGYAGLALLAGGFLPGILVGSGKSWQRLSVFCLAAVAVAACVVGPTSRGFTVGPAYQVPLNWHFLAESPLAQPWIWLALVAVGGLSFVRRTSPVIMVLASLALVAAGLANAVAPILQPAAEPAVAVTVKRIAAQIDGTEPILLGVLGAGSRDDVSLYYLKQLATGKRPPLLLTPLAAIRLANEPEFRGVVVLPHRAAKRLHRQLTAVGEDGRWVILRAGR